MTRTPRYAILLDGGFVRKVLRRHLGRHATADDIEEFCYRISGEFPAYELLRNYFYDAPPAANILTNPHDRSILNLGQTPEYRHGTSLLSRLEMKSNFALRRGETAIHGWKLGSQATKNLMRAHRPLAARDFIPDIEQKGVDLRIGLDIARFALRDMVNALVIVTGDSDLVPAFKFARREGVRIYLEHLQHPVNPILKAHSDILLSTRIDNL